MAADTLRISIYLARPSAADSPEAKALIRNWKHDFDWRPRTCVRCGDRFGPRRPRTFVAITLPDTPGAKVYGVCRQCEKAPDYEIMKAATAYMEKLVDAEAVIAH